MSFKSRRATIKKNVSERVNPGWEALKAPNVRWLWTGQIISQIGEGLNKVALLWLVYTLTGSTLKMSEIGVLQTLPPMILGPLMGVYVDRFPKRLIMIGVDLARAALAVVIPILSVLNELTMFRLYAVVFVMAIVSTIFSPALSSTVPLIVDQKQLTATNALVNSTAMVGMLIGPAVSGLGIATIGTENVLYVNGATFLLSVLCLSRLKIPPRHAETKTTRSGGSFAKDLKEGLRLVFVKRRTILMLVVAAFVYSLSAAAFVFLLPVLADETLGAGPILLGWLWTAYGGGMVLMAGGLAFSKQRSAPSRLLVVAAAMAAGSLASVVLSRVDLPILAIALAIVIGAGLASFTPIAWGLLQELTSHELRGRVFAIFNTGAMSSSMIGMVGFGWVTDRMGPRASLVGVSAVLFLTGIIAVVVRQREDVQRIPAPEG